jgi:hypothetical protein
MLVTLRENEKRLCNCLPQCDDVNFVVDFAEQIEWQVKQRNCNLNESLRTKQQQLNTASCLCCQDTVVTQYEHLG